MPAALLPNTPNYILPPPTTYEREHINTSSLRWPFDALGKFAVEWADLAIIDLSKATTQEGRAQLSAQVRDALTTSGFFYVVNHGYTPEQVRFANPSSFLSSSCAWRS